MPTRKLNVKAIKKTYVAPRPKRQGGLSVPVFSLTGVSSGKLILPQEIFGAKVKKSLLAQALRVYLNNQKGHWASTKTRADVAYSTRKVWKQKGTGRARHGAKSAPIFVGGGVALGPTPRKVVLDLPKKMKRSALIQALSQKQTEGEILGISGLEKAQGKTKQFAKFFDKLAKKSTLMVTDKSYSNAYQGVRNLPNVHMLPADQINALEVIKYQTVILTKEAIGKLGERLKQ